jgi:hypothetical protein
MISSTLIGESKRCRPHLNATPDSWWIDEAYVKVEKLILVVERKSAARNNERERE